MTNTTFRLSTAAAHRYRIQRPLGERGMTPTTFNRWSWSGQPKNYKRLGMVYHRPAVGRDEPFKLKSIRTERLPAGAEGIGWHRYVITPGDNTVVATVEGA